MQAITFTGNPELARRVFLYIAHGAVNEWSYTEYQTTGKNALVNSRITTSQNRGEDAAVLSFARTFELSAEELEKHPLKYWKMIHLHPYEMHETPLLFSPADDDALDKIQKLFPGAEFEIMRPFPRYESGTIESRDRFNDFFK